MELSILPASRHAWAVSILMCFLQPVVPRTIAIDVASVSERMSPHSYIATSWEVIGLIPYTVFMTTIELMNVHFVLSAISSVRRLYGSSRKMRGHTSINIERDDKPFGKVVVHTVNPIAEKRTTGIRSERWQQKKKNANRQIFAIETMRTTSRDKQSSDNWLLKEINSIEIDNNDFSKLSFVTVVQSTLHGFDVRSRFVANSSKLLHVRSFSTLHAYVGMMRNGVWFIYWLPSPLHYFRKLSTISRARQVTAQMDWNGPRVRRTDSSEGRLPAAAPAMATALFVFPVAAVAWLLCSPITKRFETAEAEKDAFTLWRSKL